MLVLAGGVVALGGGAEEPACGDQQLRYGADVQAADQRAVDQARSALAAVRPASPPPTAATTPAAPRATTTKAVVAGPSAARLRAAENAVEEDLRAVTSAQQEYERVVAEQQQAQDPAEYDAQVSGAEEALSVARAQLSADRGVLAGLREQARRAAASRSRPQAATVAGPTRVATAPSPAASTDRRALEQRLADAQSVQAEHLAARRTELEALRKSGCSAR